MQAIIPIEYRKLLKPRKALIFRGFLYLKFLKFSKKGVVFEV